MKHLALPAAALLAAILPELASGQAVLPMRAVEYPLHSGVHDGAGPGPAAVYEQLVTVPGAKWIRLVFAGAELGRHSLIALTSPANGDLQPLDAVAFRQWNSTSGVFTGDSVLVQLFAAPGDADVYFELEKVLVNAKDLPAAVPSTADSTCDDVDDNQPSSDNRVGRLVIPTSSSTVGICTAWRVTNGAFVTAGHCVDDDPDKEGPMGPDGVHDLGTAFVEFNVPASDADGLLNPASLADQYPVDTNGLAWQTFGWTDTSIGNDWGVFRIFPNATTGLLPHEAYGMAIRVTHDSPEEEDTVIVTGFGNDSIPLGSTGSFNSTTNTNQWASGPYGGEASTAGDGYGHYYYVDTSPGDSGGPILVPATWPDVAIGINTMESGCTTIGTSFESNDVELALHHFLGGSVVYVDVGYPIAVSQDGNIFRPFATVAAAVGAATPGALVSVVAGNYTQGAGNAITISKALVLESTMGPAVIGGL